MTRDFLDAQKMPVKGDTVEITEPTKAADGEFVVTEIMLRVLAVEEGWVWFKQYGRGRYCCALTAWRSRLGQATQGKMIQAGRDSTHELIESMEGQLEHTYQEVANVLMLMDGLAEQWGDEGVFRRCRDRLRQLVTEGQREVCEACNGTKQIEAYRGEPSQGTEMIQCPDCK